MSLCLIELELYDHRILHLPLLGVHGEAFMADLVTGEKVRIIHTIEDIREVDRGVRWPIICDLGSRLLIYVYHLVGLLN